MTVCAFDPVTQSNGNLGMFHCPECGEMVVAGIYHPDYSITQKGDDMEEKMPNDPLLNTAYNTGLEWAAKWITGASLLGHSEETIEYARNMAMSIRAAFRETNFKENFFDAVRNDPYMEPDVKKFWLEQESK